jgi:hypothetical protein
MWISNMSPNSERIAICGEVAPSYLKKRILFFDRIAAFDLESVIHLLRQNDSDWSTNLANEMEFLASKNLLFEVDIPTWEMSSDASPLEDLGDMLALFHHERSSQENDNPKDALKSWIGKHQFYARLWARHMQSTEGIAASVILSEPLIVPKQLQGAITEASPNVIDVVLDGLPMPSEQTSWEAILDFKTDTEAQGYLQGLKVWMGEIARLKLTASEAREKLEWLIFQHKKHLEMHKLSCRWGTLGGTFVATAEILEDLVKIKWGKAAGAVVSIFDKRIDLMKAELSNPAKEISYIVKAQEQFGK